MPVTSAVHAAAADNPALREWGDPIPQMLAGTLNRLGVLIVTTLQPHTRKRIPMPKPFVPPVRTRPRAAVRVIDKLPFTPPVQ